MINPTEIIRQITTAPTNEMDREFLLKQYPDPVARFFRYHLPEGIPDSTHARVPLKGIIKLVNWANFSSTLYAHPFEGFLWQARVMMGILPVKGFDYFHREQGAMQWSLFNVIPVMKAIGEDVSRSAEGRARMEPLFAPHLLIHPAIKWEVISENEITASWLIHREEQPLHLILGKDGALKSAFIQRWGNPGGVKVFGYHPFGVNIEALVKHGGALIPGKGNAGWWFGTNQYNDGEFFRFEVG
ncbi:MAG: hypothetical protein IH598_00740 [Bacteroidales bacterium]|nr:hypothetical protein [Bacteroidales bacterium]